MQRELTFYRAQRTIFVVVLMALASWRCKDSSPLACFGLLAGYFGTLLRVGRFSVSGHSSVLWTDGRLVRRRLRDKRG